MLSHQSPPSTGIVSALSNVAAVSALFGAGGFKVAVLAVVPIVLLCPTAIAGVRRLTGRSPVDAADSADPAEPAGIDGAAPPSA